MGLRALFLVMKLICGEEQMCVQDDRTVGGSNSVGLKKLNI